MNILTEYLIFAKKGQVLLVRRFRHATRTWHLEIPIVLTGKLKEGPGSTANPAELFLVNVEAYGDISKHEGITGIIQVAVSEFERMIRENELDNLFLLVTYARAKLRGLL
jgi:ADP-ribose pyrophosphatase